MSPNDPTNDQQQRHSAGGTQVLLNKVTSLSSKTEQYQIVCTTNAETAARALLCLPVPDHCITGTLPVHYPRTATLPLHHHCTTGTLLLHNHYTTSTLPLRVRYYYTTTVRPAPTALHLHKGEGWATTNRNHK